MPTRPFRIRCTLLGPSGTCINEATKNTAVITDTLGISSISMRRMVIAARTAAPPNPAAITGPESIPSDICIVRPRNIGILIRAAGKTAC